MKSEKTSSRKTARPAARTTASAAKARTPAASVPKTRRAKRARIAAKPATNREAGKASKSTAKPAAAAVAVVKTPTPAVVVQAASVATAAMPATAPKRASRIVKAKAETAAGKQAATKSAVSKAKTSTPAAPKLKLATPVVRKPVKAAAGKKRATATKTKATRKPAAKATPPAPAVQAPLSAKPAARGAKSPRTSRTVVIKPRKRITISKEEIPAILFEGDDLPPPVASGPGQRYVLGPPAPPPPTAVAAIEAGLPDITVAEAEAELPDAYGTKRLTLTARDPHWLYAAWDLTRQQLADYNALSRDGHLVLRVHLNAIAGEPLLEIPVHPESRNWLVHGGRGGTKFMAELGYYTATGEWVGIAISQATVTPPDTLAEDTTARFTSLPVDIPLPELVELVKAVVTENVPLIEAFQQLRVQGHERLPEIVAGAPEFTWTPEQEQALAEVLTMDSLHQAGADSLEITELVSRQLERGISSVSAAPPGRSGTHGKQPGGRAGKTRGVSSPLGGEPSTRNFWFNVNAELIIYGATEPDAAVTVAGRPIKLRPDGSFSCRFALPDGCYELRAVAVAADQAEARHAELQFSRSTRYTGEVGAHPQDAALKPPVAESAS